MVKLPRTGVAYQCLDEDECTLQGVMESLGLKRLSKKAERRIRDELGFALGKWDEPKPTYLVKDVVRLLNTQAKRLDKVDELGTITRGGFSRIDKIAASGQLVEVLASNSPTIGSVEEAHAYLSDFCDRAHTIASACRAAARSLQSMKGKGGKSAFHYYDGFTAVLLELCKQNRIEPTVGFDDVSGEAVGGLAKLASEFERLLPAQMRSRKPATMVKRLERSLKRLKDQPETIAAL